MCCRLGELAAEVHALEAAGIDSLHVDIMDGHFVPNLTFGPDIVIALREATQLPLRAHMMVTNPEAYVGMMADAGVDSFYFHIEAEPYPLRLASLIEDAGMTPGVAVNPATGIDVVGVLGIADVLVMAVEPGFAGQQWLPGTVSRLEAVCQMLRGLRSLGVDGNVSAERGVEAKAAGATLFVGGTSSLFRGGDYSEEVDAFRAALADESRPVQARP